MNKKCKAVSNEVLTTFNIVEQDMSDKIFPIVRVTCNYFKKLYIKHMRCAKRVFKYNQAYFDKPFQLPGEILKKVSLPAKPQNLSQSLTTDTDAASSSNVVGRGIKIFN